MEFIKRSLFFMAVLMICFNVLAQDETPVDEDEGDDSGTPVLLDEPDPAGFAFGGTVETDYVFSFTPLGPNYDENIEISFDSYVKHGGVNGFDLLLNGSRVLRVPAYRGLATFIPRSVGVDSSRVLSGENTATIISFRSTGGHFSDAGYRNVKIESSSVPLLDLTVSNVSVPNEIERGKAFDATASISNLGPKTSNAGTLSFYVSDESDRSNSTLLATQSIDAISGQASVDATNSIDSREVRNKQYFWACVDNQTDDINPANNCSSLIQLDVTVKPTSPVLMFLLDDVEPR